jgi:hypothetical protein
LILQKPWKGRPLSNTQVNLISLQHGVLRNKRKF